MGSQQTWEQLKSGQLIGINRLDLSCGLTEFPPEIFDLADTLEILNLSGNRLTKLPDDLPRLHKLRIVFCSDNFFTELPAVLGQCKNLTMVGFKANQIANVPADALAPTLQWLILTDNRIQELPSSIGQCKQMQKLMLAGNRLSGLPVELAQCANLELLRLSANQFSELPAWLLAMPKLAWLAIAGNPLTDSFEATHQKVQANTEIAITEAATIHGFTSMVQINWKNIEQGAKLGEGASGVIYQAKLNESIDLYTDVAIKLFKNDVTSDGLPRCEMAASIAVGLHANIVGVSGAISHHPQGVQGLIMPLISPDYVNLAQPPSLETCTRDVYAASTAFSLMQLCVIVSGVARAAAHLHACGVMHGDLYGHNILHNATGHSLLGDFGAASFLPMNDAAMSQALQRIEVRAFGILLGELLSLCVVDAMETQQHGMHRLQILQQECIQPDISARPLFTNIAQELEQCKHHIDVASSIS